MMNYLNYFKSLKDSFLQNNCITINEQCLSDIKKINTQRECIEALYASLMDLSYENRLNFVDLILYENSNAFLIYSQLGNLFFANGFARLAAVFYARAIKLKPDYSKALKWRGNALRVIGEVEEAVNSYRESLAIDPDPSVWARMLFSMHFEDCWSPEEIAAEHKAYGDYFRKSPGDYSFDKHTVEKLPLTVGYVSPDFKRHPVAYFIQPILANHNPAIVRSIAYATTRNNDGVTRRIKGMCSEWREVQGMEASDLADLIHQDGVDILVDLAGHTTGNRLDVFALRPAPIQITYLGYPNGTGLEAMDYRISDSITDPPGRSDLFYREKIIRIDPIFLCFEPPMGSPMVSDSPCKNNGFVTLGSFNKFSKLSKKTIIAWASILEEVPETNLLIKTGGLEASEEKEIALERFASAGVKDLSRIELLDLLPTRNDHLRLYSRLDIALDPFPYNGTTTTCQALWMGVPVVTLLGTHHVSRVGGGILEQMGLGYLVAKNLDDYIRIVSDLARNPRMLVDYRNSIRRILEKSPMLDHVGFVEKLESAYQKIWLDRDSIL